ncbi:hypothetical protein APHWI1_1221 [Anaplasma phagocytophilum str. ApWI1]|nr:hypothetical protein APHHGE2_0447 [Anaplasma phagocytophilum str. HGE2]KJV85029.1 hypothetical protein APHWI1_1221 [Anaplasma phagocytophilum str. ApWI1]KJV99483.1 hypothetical protein OTSANNIE_0418 [Anaplasma phagocytophilum str. Annie]KJZ99457.1 hypothetical protein APHCR_1176 [Anaplasma phagocytophilum str. CR1007]KJZ99834.1 hypothetical protein APHDU1_0975 [Anaplasma phagocytophilum]
MFASLRNIPCLQLMVEVTFYDIHCDHRSHKCIITYLTDYSIGRSRT